MPIILAGWKTEAGGYQVPVEPGQFSESLSQLKGGSVVEM